MSAREIAEQWLNEVVRTVSEKDYDAHMDLISQRVRLTGLAQFDSLGYQDWANQCQYEFENNVIDKVEYSGFKLRAKTDGRIMFKTFERVAATDGKVNAQGIEVLLEKEDDGKWRLVHERVLPDNEARNDGLLSG